jgi:hypothetical protein
MKNIREFETWRAEEIAKVFLLNSGLVTLVPEYGNKYDFLAISKKSPDKKVAVEVKATKYSKDDIKRVFTKTKEQFSKSELPVLLMYINYDKENGYFEVLEENGVRKKEIQPLQTEKLTRELSELIK